MIELLEKLCALPGPSGCEDAVHDFILEQAKLYADEIREDHLGNLMIFRKGKQHIDKTVMLSAHMDEVGVICKGYTDDGCVKFGFVGGVDPRVVIGRRILFGDVRGVVGIKAVHLTTREERKTMPKTSSLYIDIGASDKKEAQKKVPLGTYGVFDSACVRFGDGLLKAKAIDDRVGCADDFAGTAGSRHVVCVWRTGRSWFARRPLCGICAESGCLSGAGRHNGGGFGRSGRCQAGVRSAQGRCHSVYGSLDNLSSEDV